MIAWLLAALASLGVIVVVVSGGPIPSPSPSASAGASSSAAVPVTSVAVPTPSVTPVASASNSPVACVPTDQDQYVYHPARLIVKAACITVTGTIFSIKTEADGDLHIRLTVDPVYQNLINAVNVSGQLGKLVIEPVCEKTVTQTDAQATCAADHGPIDISAMRVGDHVTMNGRYVTDSQHGGWAELHPLYAWGVQP